MAPITERILSAIGGSRPIWMALWAATALVSPVVFSTVVRATGRPFPTVDFLDAFWTQVGLTWATLVTLWGCARLGKEAHSTRDELSRELPDRVPERLFAAIARADGPLLLTAVVVGITIVDNGLAYGPLPPLATLPLFVGYMLPIATFIWVYVAILADINRLGELPLVLDRFPQDRTMGIGHIGSLASTGLGVLLVAAVPVLLLAADEPITVAIGLTLVIGSVGVYGLSMWRLHRQMAAAKERYVANARRLYADAYAPIRSRPDVETLEASSSALSVAQSLDERAAALPTWPIDEGTARFVAVVITGVLTSLIVRALFAAIGF
ncbi:MAG TPA: hypothetical protein VK867_04220 [Candidatus Limnocylindrales bacterium]|nr:hypothetical protein [Candidatus Limnocylindrales bacterium]